MASVGFTHPLWREVSGKRCALVGVEALAAIEELWQEGRVESWEIHSRHVVERQRDVVLQEVVALVQEDLQENIYEVEQHGVPEQLLKRTRKHKNNPFELNKYLTPIIKQRNVIFNTSTFFIYFKY